MSPLLALVVGLAHGGTPQVRDILFPSQFGYAPFAVTDNQGIYGHTGEQYRWLCEDVVLPSVGLRAVAIRGAAADQVLLGTLDGLMASRDRGCSWAPVDDVLGDAITAGLWPHPEAPLELLAAAANFADANRLRLSEDGGQTWRPVGPELYGTPAVYRASDPARVYLNSGQGLFRSDDGGRTFEPIALGPPALAVEPAELNWLGGSPADPDVVFAVVERLPTAHVIRSVDGGESWVEVLALDDFPHSLVFPCDGAEALLVAPFLGFFRSADGSATWTAEGVSPDQVGVVRRQPGTARLWSATNVYAGGPWVLAFSDDFGRSWTPHLQAFGDVGQGWGCPVSAPTTEQCAGLCPGLPPGATCAPTDDRHSPPPAPTACPGWVPAPHQAADAGVAEPAGAVEPDAPAPQAAPETDPQGCEVAPSAPLLALLLLGAARRKPPRGGPHA